MSDAWAGALLGALVGFPFGACASIFAWWVLFHGFRPKLLWVDAVDLMHRPDMKPPVEYAVAFKNVGRRAGVEVNTHARLRIKGLVEARPQRWIVLEIPTNNQLIPRSLPYKKSGTRHLLVLQPNAIRSADLQRLPNGLGAKVASGEMGLQDLMRLGSAAELRLAAMCSDAFSGSRHAFVSEPLSLDDFVEGDPA